MTNTAAVKTANLKPALVIRTCPTCGHREYDDTLGYAIRTRTGLFHTTLRNHC